MDFIEGQTLESYLEANGGKLPLEEVLAIGVQLCLDLIASASLDGTVQIWNPQTGEHHFTYKEHCKPVQTVAWEPGGFFIASGGDDKNVRVWRAWQDDKRPKK